MIGGFDACLRAHEVSTDEVRRDVARFDRMVLFAARMRAYMY